MMPFQTQSRTAGFPWMSLAVLIWASWLVLTSSGRTTSLSVLDLAVFRAVVPALILAPLLWRQRAEVVRIGPVRCLLLSTYGAPFTLCVGFGLGLAPVVHAGAMIPGMMPVLALFLGLAASGQRPGVRQSIAFALIVSGAMTILAQDTAGDGLGPLWVGHILFLGGALCWATFTVVMQRSAVPPFLATAIVGAVSSLLLLPFWAVTEASNLDVASVHDIALQVLFQGVVSGLVSLFAFSRALVLIPDMAAPLSALTPGVATVLAIPVLGQVPSTLDALALALVIAGLLINAHGSRPALNGAGQTSARPGRDQTPSVTSREADR